MLSRQLASINIIKVKMSMHIKMRKFLYPHNLVYEVFEREVPDAELSVGIFDGAERILESRIGEQEAFMLVLRYLHGLSIREIADYYGLTAAQAFHIIKKALLKLRHPHRNRCFQNGGTKAMQ